MFGNEIDVADPTLAGVVLRVAWLYFGFRYFQYYMDLPSKGVRELFYARMHVLVQRIARRQVVRQYQWDAEWKDVRDLKIERGDLSTLNAYPSAWRLRLNGVIAGHTRGGTHARQISNREIIVSGPQLQFAKVRTSFYVVVCTRFFTEYYLPFSVAAVPIALGVYKMSRGSA